MQEHPPLASAFLHHASVPVVVPRDTREFEAQLRRAWERSRESWPQVPVSPEAFVRHLAERLSEDSEGRELEALLARLSLGDLYLTCACVREQPEALQVLEHHFLAKLPSELSSLKLPTITLDEVRQSVRIHLLVGSSDAGPRLGEYRGRGSLMSWLRAITVRMALKQAPARREVSEDYILEAIEAMPAAGFDAELELIKRRYRHEFREAVQQSLAALSPEQRYQLRLYFIDRLSTTEMGEMFRVNQSTVSRWLKNARQAVYEDTKHRLQERLGLSSVEFSSLLAAIESQFDLSLSQVFETER